MSRRGVLADGGSLLIGGCSGYYADRHHPPGPRLCPMPTSEMSMNTRTAALLREYGLDAEAEQRIPDTTASPRQFHQLDIAVGVGDESVAIEAEFDPARTVLRRGGEQATAAAVGTVVLAGFGSDSRGRGRVPAWVQPSERE